jgi:hypothetical protein
VNSKPDTQMRKKDSSHDGGAPGIGSNGHLQSQTSTGKRKSNVQAKSAHAAKAEMYKPYQLESLRLMLLLRAAEVSLRGLPVIGFHLSARVFGFEASVEDIQRELQYLLDKGLVTELPKLLSLENRWYRISANGRDYLAEQEIEP